VKRLLQKSGLEPGSRVAITAGSRGMRNAVDVSVPSYQTSRACLSGRAGRRRKRGVLRAGEGGLGRLQQGALLLTHVRICDA
jgi:hypothetical protein